METDCAGIAERSVAGRMQDKLEPRCLSQNSYGRSSVNVDSVEDVDQLERFARGTQNDSNVSPVDLHDSSVPPVDLNETSKIGYKLRATARCIIRATARCIIIRATARYIHTTRCFHFYFSKHLHSMCAIN